MRVVRQDVGYRGSQVSDPAVQQIQYDNYCQMLWSSLWLVLLILVGLKL